jgi:hypothetical protein
MRPIAPTQYIQENFLCLNIVHSGKVSLLYVKYKFSDELIFKASTFNYEQNGFEQNFH